MIVANMLLAVLTQAPQVEGVWENDPVRLAAIKDFLTARATTWEESFPSTLCWSEWDENSAGAVAWSGTYHCKQLHADYTVFPEGVGREAARNGAAGHRASLICDGRRWLVVERPIPDEQSRPWSGVDSATCPTRHWSTTMLSDMLLPLYGMSMVQYLDRHDLVRIKETRDSIDVEFAATPIVAKCIAERKFNWLRGVLGVAVTFNRDCGWRPTSIREIHTVDTVDPRPGVENIERTEFGGIPALLLRSYRWGRWTKLGSVTIPTTFEADLAVRIEVEGLIPLRSITHKELEATIPAEPPAGTFFALTAPDWMGPVGRISNTETGVVQVFDARGLAERIDSRSSFVNLLTDNAKRSSFTPAETAAPSWLALVLLSMGALSLGWVSMRMVHARKRVV